ncbi:uncharacterized protein LOC134271241 isoform X2 [Saccostrea cucullata]|uniref:uncharacterized protein LOC134271241 isoform X1 n=1 Tax=Saccostrea cuccullata TaxID=36930 RepID=UPI002ED5EFB7
MDSIRSSQITEGIQHISESVFVGLCHKVGTSQVVAMRRDVVDILEMVMNHLPKSDKIGTMVSGSYGEGFRLKGSDRDFMYWPNNHRVIWDLSQSKYYNTHRQTLILCDCSDSPHGFTLLYLLSTSMDRRIHRACVRMNNEYYVSSSKYRQITLSALSIPYNPTPHGPCASGTIGRLEHDHAHCFVSDLWPPSAFPWIDRCHSWPQPHVVHDIVKNGCHFVAIGHKLGKHEDHEWRISFSLAEQKLVYVMNHCQFLTYGLLKLFLTEIINNGVGDDDKLLCSYHMKTAVFWVIQQNTIPHWCPQNLLGCFWVCFKLILKWVYEGVCPNFFIPGNNMFLSKIHGVKQHQLFISMSELYEKGLAFLVHSPSIRSCMIDVLYNPRNSICTNDHTLISEAEFDRNLFREILPLNIISGKLNIQSYIRYLHSIEQMIGSSLLTQYQVITLQNMIASALQNTAFIFHMETYTPENKLSYRADKMSCHMLKLTAKLGCITDMLYIAMYYYKALRYVKALSVIEMIKVKLAQPYVMYSGNVDTALYIEAVGGQSWSTKIRQVVVGDIILYNGIHYISELIPEQQSALQRHMSILYIPHLVLLYMLEILCYRLVDTMRVQTALDDLQTLVHYDLGQLIPLDYRDISWQILGICQQVTGNLQAALYSYQQSLRQKPFHKIQTATQMRIQRIYQWIPLIN